jgi:hypothetical protein
MMFLRERLIVFLFPLLFAAPFLNRATFVDDSYFVEIASWLKDNPGQPYDFTVDDAKIGAKGWEDDGFVRMVNPLAHHYFLAGLMKLGGSSTAWLRFGCVLLSCFGALLIFELARRWTYHPLLATLLVLSTPAYSLTSYSLLIDSTTGFLFFLALYCFVRAAERDQLAFYAASGFSMGLAILSKYPAVLIVPLTACWAWFRWHKLERKWMIAVPWGIAFGMLAGYSLWTDTLYGAPHILAASQRMVQSFGWPKLFVFLVFLSGTTLVPLISWAAAPWKIRLGSGLFFLAFVFFFSSRMGGFTAIQAGLLSLWLVTSVLFLIGLFEMRFQFENPKDGFLFIWLLGFIAMMYAVMGWVAARYYVIALPAIGFLAVRMTEIKWPNRAAVLLRGMVVLNLVFSVGLAYADYKQASPSRELPALLEAKGFRGGERHFYLGDSFTMSYLREHGWVPCFPGSRFQPGDWVLAKDVTMPQNWFYQSSLNLHLLAEFHFPSRFPFKVMDNKGSAGWYASVWGALPFTVSFGPWERFRLYEVGDALEAVS